MPGAFSYGMTPANSPKGSAFQAVQPSVIPVGVIEMFAGSTAPNGWLVCNGTTVSRKTYSDLFKVIGTTYGAGNSNDTFTLPDMRGRFAMGAGTGTGLNSSGTGAISGSAQTARTVGQWLGEETHLLTTAELASHTHANTVGSSAGGSNQITGTMNSNTSHAHQNANVQGTSGGQYGIMDTANAGSSGRPFVTTTNTDHTHAIGINNVAEGGNIRHNIIPPCVVVNYIIKV